MKPPARRRNIFIASSSEALPIARAVKKHFQRESDVDIWNENIFKVNRGYLETLLNRASYYDYCIAIFAADDAARIRDKAVKVTRHNVIFEFGLFLGRLGVTFRASGNLVAAVRKACKQIREAIGHAGETTNFTMLPSTALAIGYYNNFLKRVFEAFEFSETLSIAERHERHNRPLRAIS